MSSIPKLVSILNSIYFILVQHAKGSFYEEMLQDNLLKNYNPLLRPVRYYNETFKANVGIGIHQLISVSEREQMMKINHFIELSWFDKNLIWNPTEYGGLETIRLPADSVWRPEIVLFNNADGQYTVTYRSKVVVQHDGAMLWVPISIHKSTCKVDIRYFPFDQQICELRFGSWTYNASQLTFDYYQGRKWISLVEYHPSGSWDIIDVPGKIVYLQNNSRVEIVFSVVIRRKSLFYTINLLIPLVLTGFLSVVRECCIFHLPSDAGEKIIVSISTLMSINVFLVLTGKLLPHCSVIPLISKYVIFSFFVNMLTIISTIIIININYRTPRTYRMPPLFRRIFIDILPPYLMIRKPRHNNGYDCRPETGEMLPSCSVIEPDDCYLLSKNESAQNDDLNSETKHFERCARSMLQDIALRTNSVASQLQHEGRYAMVREEWRLAATVIDRIFLFLTMVVFFAGTLLIMLSSPYLFMRLKKQKQQ